MTKTPQATDSVVSTDEPQGVVPESSNTPLNHPIPPAERGMAHLRAQDLDPLRLWTVKSPRGVGGTLSAVFLQATSEIVLLQQLESGRFVLFNKAPQ